VLTRRIGNIILEEKFENRIIILMKKKTNSMVFIFIIWFVLFEFRLSAFSLTYSLSYCVFFLPLARATTSIKWTLSIEWDKRGFIVLTDLLLNAIFHLNPLCSKKNYSEKKRSNINLILFLCTHTYSLST
jgi:hypothetical protein